MIWICLRKAAISLILKFKKFILVFLAYSDAFSRNVNILITNNLFYYCVSIDGAKLEEKHRYIL